MCALTFKNDEKIHGDGELDAFKVALSTKQQAVVSDLKP